MKRGLRKTGIMPSIIEEKIHLFLGRSLYNANDLIKYFVLSVDFQLLHEQGLLYYGHQV